MPSTGLQDHADHFSDEENGTQSSKLTWARVSTHHLWLLVQCSFPSIPNRGSSGCSVFRKCKRSLSTVTMVGQHYLQINEWKPKIQDFCNKGTFLPIEVLSLTHTTSFCFFLIISMPNMGLDLMTLRSNATRSTEWASQAPQPHTTFKCPIRCEYKTCFLLSEPRKKQKNLLLQINEYFLHVNKPEFSKSTVIMNMTERFDSVIFWTFARGFTISEKRISYVNAMQDIGLTIQFPYYSAFIAVTFTVILP